MGNLIVSLFLFLSLTFTSADEKFATSTRSNEVCDLDSSCSSTTDFPVEISTDKVNISEKWKYNISDGLVVNETTDVSRINEANGTVNFEIDLTSKTLNRSVVTNESKPINIKYQIHLEDKCFCDITKGSCDMNCCCDRDCLYVNRNVFKNCNETKREEIKDSFCPSKILNSPLLCIVKDNLYSRHFYPQHKMTPEAANVDKLLKNRDVYSWSFPSLPTETDVEYEYDKESQEYDAGSPVLLFTNYSRPSVEKLRLPKATITSRDCDNTEAVNFLENYEETCTHRIQNQLAVECEHPGAIFNPMRYVKSFVIKNPSLINQSMPLDCSFNCVNVTALVCENDDITACKPMNLTAAPSLSRYNVCQQAVTHVHYNFLHNGTEGILAAQVYFQLENIILKPNLLWALTFKLTYQWFNQTQFYELSGYPGYIFRKPVITGFIVPKSPKENITRYSMQMHHQRQRWLTVFRTRNDGECNGVQRRNILFEENLYAHCFIKVPSIRNVVQCENFQNEILDVIFGPYVNISNMYVSIFGDPEINDSSKWIPAVVNFPTNLLNDSCSGILTAVKIVLLHAKVGEHDNPQQSIFAVKVTGNTFDRNIHQHDKLKISFAVNFYDVTNPPLRIFAEPPTYEVKLPTDFFYPFFSGVQPLNGNSVLLTLILIGTVLYMNYT